MKARTRNTVVYEMIMLSLALLSLLLIWVEHPVILVLDLLIWAVFVGDVAVRLIRADNKLAYIRQNPLDLIAIIPLDSIFRVARIARVFRILRIIAISTHYMRPLFTIIQTNGLNKVLTATFALIFLASIPIYFIEPSIATYEDALWWSIVTTTTVGYGDLSPSTFGGRMIAILLMIFGIGLIGMITGSIATYFISEEKNKKPDADAEYIRQLLDRGVELRAEDYDLMIAILQKMKNSRKPAENHNEPV